MTPDASAPLDLAECDLQGSRFQNVDLRGARFGDANLADAAFNDVNLCAAQFRDVRLRGARLTNADLSDVEILNARITGMRINGVLLSDLFEAFRRGTERPQATTPRAAPKHSGMPRPLPPLRCDRRSHR